MARQVQDHLLHAAHGIQVLQETPVGLRRRLPQPVQKLHHALTGVRRLAGQLVDLLQQQVVQRIDHETGVPADEFPQMRKGRSRHRPVLLLHLYQKPVAHIGLVRLRTVCLPEHKDGLQVIFRAAEPPPLQQLVAEERVLQPSAQALIGSLVHKPAEPVHILEARHNAGGHGLGEPACRNPLRHIAALEIHDDMPAAPVLYSVIEIVGVRPHPHQMELHALPRQPRRAQAFLVSHIRVEGKGGRQPGGKDPLHRRRPQHQVLPGVI